MSRFSGNSGQRIPADTLRVIDSTGNLFIGHTLARVLSFATSINQLNTEERKLRAWKKGGGDILREARVLVSMIGRFNHVVLKADSKYDYRQWRIPIIITVGKVGIQHALGTGSET